MPDITTVLIVEDHVDMCEVLGEFVRTMGLRVATAHDGRAAVEAIRRAPSEFGIVITDLHLPGVDGFEVLRAVRTANPSSHVVVITGYATIDTAIRAVREGAYDYLAKPFALGQLEVVLRRIEDRRALEAENRALARRTAGRELPVPDVLMRLDALESRLAAIERLLRER